LVGDLQRPRGLTKKTGELRGRPIDDSRTLAHERQR
jgi:hypothetical protein